MFYTNIFIYFFFGFFVRRSHSFFPHPNEKKKPVYIFDCVLPLLFMAWAWPLRLRTVIGKAVGYAPHPLASDLCTSVPRLYITVPFCVLWENASCALSGWKWSGFVIARAYVYIIPIERIVVRIQRRRFTRTFFQ